MNGHSSRNGNHPFRVPSQCDGVLLRHFLWLIRVSIFSSAALNCLSTSLGKDSLNEVQSDGPVLHYTFDTRPGDTIENEAGEKHSGRNVGALFSSGGAVGRALVVWKDQERFGYVETPTHQDLNSPRFTVAAWIKLRRPDSHGSVVCKHDWTDGKSRGFVLRCYAPEQINFTIGAGGWKSTDGTTRVPANQWSHVAGTYDGRHIRIFVNGRLEGTNEIKQAYTPSPLPLRIGHAAFAMENKRKFDGQIDDVMVWNRALSEQELRALVRVQERH